MRRLRAASASIPRPVVVLSGMRGRGLHRLLAGWVISGTILVAGCGQWQRVGENPAPSAEREVTQMFDASSLFQRLGRLVSTQAIPFVGSVAFAPGTGDSTLAVVAISLANHALAFERRGNGFAARSRVDYEFDRTGASPIVVSREEPVVVGSFQETMRTDESILLQQQVMLAPGSYQLTVRVRDLSNAQNGAAAEKVIAPEFGPGSYTAPILAYRVRGRNTRDDSLSIVLNPRGTVAYGGDTLLVYVEGNDFTRPTDVPLQFRDEHDSVVFRTSVHFEGNGRIEGRIVRMAPDSAPLGQLEIIMGPENALPPRGAPQRFAVAPGGDLRHRTNAVVSFSAAWVVTNFDDLLSLLRYFGEDRRVEAMRRAKGTDRVQLWLDFVHATDPVPATPENEALDAYFSRIVQANQRFHEPGIPGWRTDRGEVFIVLGDPDQISDQSSQLQNAGRIIIWEYLQYRVDLYFQDITGFGRFQLTPQSRADFDQVRARVRHVTG
ncbi:MAG: GWxTD domain-containing protein [Gemmatimonadales bacterium]